MWLTPAGDEMVPDDWDAGIRSGDRRLPQRPGDPRPRRPGRADHRPELHPVLQRPRRQCRLHAAARGVLGAVGDGRRHRRRRGRRRTREGRPDHRRDRQGARRPPGVHQSGRRAGSLRRRIARVARRRPDGECHRRRDRRAADADPEIDVPAADPARSSTSPRRPPSPTTSTISGADWMYLSPILKAEARLGPRLRRHRPLVGRPGPRWPRGARRRRPRPPASSGSGCSSTSCPTTSGWPRRWRACGGATCSPTAVRPRYAEAFDVDWEFGGGKVRIPVLGDEPEPELHVVDGELLLPRPPLPAGARVRPTTDASPAEVHARQHYELINWRRADAELNYRRFFAVNTLAGIRVEVPVGVRRVARRDRALDPATALADGLRVDHPDGLADPGGYLDALAAATGGAYVLVEKILEGDEQLPPSWATAGTTGYDALADIDRILVDPSGQVGPRSPSTPACAAPPGRCRGRRLIHDTKREIADGILRSEVLRSTATSRRPAVSAPGRRRSAEDAVAELLACFPVYRSYLPLGIEHLHDGGALGQAAPAPGAVDTVDAVVAVLADAAHPAARPVPADVGHGHGQGRRGHRVLPVQPARLAHRGGRRPRRVLDRRRRVPPPPAVAPGQLPDVDDHAVDPRHQARRGRPRPHQRARRDPRRVGADARRRSATRPRSATARSSSFCGRRSSVRGRRRANGCTRTPRRRRARRGPRPRWIDPDEDFERRMHDARRQRLRRPCGRRD